ncbi:MAG: zinc-dependent alcohol dehydrogenase family protein [bacterium]|nr:zinc-dependent alcohol dehydrogenase family protein [bacterium]
MRAMVLEKPAPIENQPLILKELEIPQPKENKVLIRVLACGVCHTDLHIVEGDIIPPRYPIIPGHQVIGRIENLGARVKEFKKGELVGVPWLHSTCGECKYCKKGLSNLCENISFTGFHVNGGYAEYMIANKTAIYRLPETIDIFSFAPILCGGVIGYRAFKLTNLTEGQKLGLVGFGSSAHIVLQIAIHRKMEVYVFSRSEAHRKKALEMGAKWVGKLGDTFEERLDGIIVFAPVGETLIESLRYVDKGGTVVSAGIYMSDIPSFPYSLLYEERSLKSTANSTREDVEETIKLAVEIPIRPLISTYPLEHANKALQDVKYSRLDGSAVLIIG